MALLKDYLIAHYKLNDDAATAVIVDETGNHNGEYQLNSVAQNTSTGASTGKILGALDFVGGANGENIEIADHADFSPGDGTTGTPFSISAWIYMHDATNFRIVTKGIINVTGEWVFALSGDDKIYFYLLDNSEGAVCRIGKNYSGLLTSYQNQWIHIVGTYDGGILASGVKIYLNAVRIDDTDLITGTFVAVENLDHAVWIGRYSTTYADGLIDNMKFFNKELTLLEVKYLYNSGAGVETVPSGIQLSHIGQRFSSHQEI